MTVAPKTLIPIEEYLHTAYSPDVDYIDGLIEDRNVGEYTHARTQMALSAYLYNREKQWGIRVVPEQRVRVSVTRVRIPDVCAVLGEPGEQVFTQPPFLCVEILSPEDRLARVQQRIDDYFAMGVAHVWLLDPESRRAWVCKPGVMAEVTDAVLRADPVVVPLAEIWP